MNVVAETLATRRDVNALCAELRATLTETRDALSANLDRGARPARACCRSVCSPCRCELDSELALALNHCKPHVDQDG